jgi:hypothetical protein
MYLTKNKKGIVQIPLIIGLVIMAVALPVVANLVKSNTENRSKAASSALSPVCAEILATRWMYKGVSGCVKSAISDCKTCGGDYLCYSEKEGCDGANPQKTVEPTIVDVCKSGENRWMYKGIGCVSSSVKNCDKCGGSYTCYVEESACIQAHPEPTVSAESTCGSRANGSKWCNGDKIQICNAPRRQIFETCPSGQLCDEATLTCKGTIVAEPTKATEVTRAYCKSDYSCVYATAGTEMDIANKTDNILKKAYAGVDGWGQCLNDCKKPVEIISEVGKTEPVAIETPKEEIGETTVSGVCNDLVGNCTNANFNSFKAKGDFDCDGKTSIVDFSVWKSLFLNKTGCVNFGDFGTWKELFN